MFGLGFSEIVVIFVVVLLVLGPKRLPTIARQAGKAMRELNRASADFRSTLEKETQSDDSTLYEFSGSLKEEWRAVEKDGHDVLKKAADKKEDNAG